MKEARKLVYDYCFNTLNVHEIHAQVWKDNVNSVKSLEHAGHVLYKEEEKLIEQLDAYHVECNYKITRETCLNSRLMLQGWICAFDIFYKVVLMKCKFRSCSFNIILRMFNVKSSFVTLYKYGIQLNHPDTILIERLNYMILSFFIRWFKLNASFVIKQNINIQLKHLDINILFYSTMCIWLRTLLIIF